MTLLSDISYLAGSLRENNWEKVMVFATPPKQEIYSYLCKPSTREITKWELQLSIYQALNISPNPEKQ